MGGKSSGSLGAGMIAGKTPWQRQMTVERLWHTRLSTDLPPLLSIYGDDRHAGFCALLWRHLTNKKSTRHLQSGGATALIDWDGPAKFQALSVRPGAHHLIVNPVSFPRALWFLGMFASVARKTATQITRQR